MPSMYGQERNEQVARLVSSARSILDREGVSRSSLAKVLKQLETLADRTYLWSSASYPDPTSADKSILYNIAEEPDRAFALYLDVACPGKKIPPHNHETWACIAAIKGCEDNTLYRREDDGATLDKCRLKQTGFIEVKPGRAIALIPDDIHAIANSGSAFGRHLHFYGKALEALTTRLQFDLQKNTAKVMPPAVTVRI